jgi:hypothetical protein
VVEVEAVAEQSAAFARVTRCRYCPISQADMPACMHPVITRGRWWVDVEMEMETVVVLEMLVALVFAEEFVNGVLDGEVDAGVDIETDMDVA